MNCNLVLKYAMQLMNLTTRGINVMPLLGLKTLMIDSERVKNTCRAGLFQPYLSVHFCDVYIMFQYKTDCFSKEHTFSVVRNFAYNVLYSSKAPLYPFADKIPSILQETAHKPHSHILPDLQLNMIFISAEPSKHFVCTSAHGT